MILRKTPPPAFDAGPDRVFVSVLYLTLLQRPPNPEEARTLTAELAKGARKEILVRGLLSSPEFTGYAPR